MIKTRNFVIAETIALYNFCFILNLLEHLGFNTDAIRMNNINVIIHKCFADNVVKLISTSDKNIFDGLMNWLKLPNKKMCDICNSKKKCFRECSTCKNKMCIECFKIHNKEYINSCPYCRYDFIEHTKRTNNRCMLNAMLVRG